MDGHDPLAGLKDIHLPSPIGFWPLAPGWYILIFLALVVSFLLYTRYQRGKIRKEALAILKSIRKRYVAKPNSQKESAEINELLKRVALAYYPRHEVASLHGKKWLEFLNDTGKHVNFTNIDYLLLEVPFKPQESIDTKPLFEQAKLWIQQRRKPCV